MLTKLKTKVEKFLCEGCGYIKDVSTYWVNNSNQELKCPACQAHEKWHKIPRNVSPERYAAEHMGKLGVPADLWQIILISRYNGKSVKSFQGNKWKLTPEMKRLFEMDEYGRIRQKFDVVTNQDFEEEERPEGLEVNLANKEPKKKYGVRVKRK